jgi:hypothetical protein
MNATSRTEQVGKGFHHGPQRKLLITMKSPRLGCELKQMILCSRTTFLPNQWSLPSRAMQEAKYNGLFEFLKEYRCSRSNDQDQGQILQKTVRLQLVHPLTKKNGSEAKEHSHADDVRGRC